MTLDDLEQPKHSLAEKNRLYPSIHVYLHQETNHITQARQKSRTERSMNDAHNCPIMHIFKELRLFCLYQYLVEDLGPQVILAKALNTIVCHWTVVQHVLVCIDLSPSLKYDSGSC